MDSDLEANKQTAVAFYRTAFLDKEPEKAVRLYVGDDYKQHDPVVPDGKQGLIDYARYRGKTNPNRTMSVKRMIAEGDYVVMHVNNNYTATDENHRTAPQGMACVDIFRFDNGKIVEHWNVRQPVPAEAVHGNTMF